MSSFLSVFPKETFREISFRQLAVFAVAAERKELSDASSTSKGKFTVLQNLSGYSTFVKEL